MSGWAGQEVGPGLGGDCYNSECEIFNINLIKFGSVTKTKLAGLVAGRGGCPVSAVARLGAGRCGPP